MSTIKFYKDSNGAFRLTDCTGKLAYINKGDIVSAYAENGVCSMIFSDEVYNRFTNIHNKNTAITDFVNASSVAYNEAGLNAVLSDFFVKSAGISSGVEVINALGYTPASKVNGKVPSDELPSSLAVGAIETSRSQSTDKAVASSLFDSNITLLDGTLVDVQSRSMDLQDKLDFNGCVKAFYSLTTLGANERLVISFFARIGTTNTFQIGLNKYNTSTQATTEIAATTGLVYEFGKIVPIYDVSAKTNIVGYIHADVNNYIGAVANIGQGLARMPYCLPICFDSNKQNIINNYFLSNRMYTSESKLSNIDTDKQNITVWGDSITWGSASTSSNNCYTAILRQLLVSNGYKEGVINCGVGGENFHNILVRQGGLGFYLASDVVLPANTTEKVAVQSTSGWINNRQFRNTYHGSDSYFSLLLQGETGRDNTADEYKTVNPLRVNGIEVIMTIEGDIQNNVLYLSPKYTQSSTTFIKAGTLIYPNGNTFKPKVSVFAIGTNGGFTVYNNSILDLNASINQYIELIEIARQKHGGNFIVCSPYAGTALSELSISGLQSLESALRKKYGARYFNWREYLVNYGLSDAGITPNSADNTAISQGLVPPSLLSDGLHPNDSCHLVLGRKLYYILLSLGYITKL